MCIETMVYRVAGLMVLIGFALGTWVAPWGFYLCAFVGLNLLQASFTKFCPLASILKAMGMKNGATFQ